MKVRPSISKTVGALEKAAHGNEAPIWSKIIKMARGSISADRVVNIKKIAEHTNEGDSVIVPGKVLGVGDIPHKITLYSFSISEPAAKIITKAGGSVKPVEDAVKNHPTGKGLIMLG